MGTLSPSRTLQMSRMPSYTSSSYSLTTTTTTSEGTMSRTWGAASAGSDLDDLYFKSFCMSDGDRCRMGREFFSPAPISLTGNYWPRYSNCDKSVPQTGSAYVTYLARPYFNATAVSMSTFSATRLQALTPASMVTQSTSTLGSFEATMKKSIPSC